MKKINENERLHKILVKKLHEEKVFWSYDISGLDLIPDDILIAKVLMHLDIEDIKLLLLLFPKRKIQKVWKEKMVAQEPMYHGLNRLYSFLFFNIKHPDRYLRNYKNQRYKSLICKV